MTVSAITSHGKGLPRVSGTAVLGVLRKRGGTASRATLVRALGVPTGTVARRLKALVASGQVERIERGSYRLARSELAKLLPSTAADIVQALGASGAEAHLTGFDLLASHSHQFVRTFPHLVYADPAALDEVSFALSQVGFLPVPAGQQARNVIAHAPDLDRIVVLRGQPIGRMERFGVRSTIGPPEKAWLDLLRETRAGSLPVSLADLGAILASLLRSGTDQELLKRWAREMGYQRHVQAVLDPSAAQDDPELRELTAGATR